MLRSELEISVSKTDEFVINLQYQRYHPAQIICLELSNKNITVEEIALITNSLKQQIQPLNLKLMLKNNWLTPKAIHLLIDLLATPSCLSTLHLDLSYCSLNNNILYAFANLFTFGYYPKSLSLKLSGNNKFGLGGIKALAKALKINKIAYGLAIDLSNNILITKHIPLIAEAMKFNTAVIYINIDQWRRDLIMPHKKIIDYCCLRNKLIKQYPYYAATIKALSYEQGLYKTALLKKHSLKLFEMSCLIVLKNKVVYQVLPEEIRNFLDALKLLTESACSDRINYPTYGLS
jgi:hypothetical protein